MNILKNFTAALLLAVPLFQADLTAQSDNLMKAILYLSGADSEEELDEQEMERFSVLASSPLEINLVSRSRMATCGLMSQYQVASLMDYRGDNPDGRLLNDDEDDSPDMDIPLHSVSPWPKRALKSPMMTLPILLLPKYVIFIAHADGGNRSLSEYLVLAADENSKDSP